MDILPVGGLTLSYLSKVLQPFILIIDDLLTKKFHYFSLCMFQEKTVSANSESRSGFQPYRPDETRSSLASGQPTAPTPPNPYGLDPAAAAAYSPYHAAAAAAAAAAAFYPPHMQHAYR